MTDQEIEKLKALCEKEGFELDFISKSSQGGLDIFRVEKKIERVRVEFTWSEGLKEDYRFHFKVSTNDNLHHAGHHLAKCLEDFLNKSQ